MGPGIPSRSRSRAGERAVDALLGACFGFLRFGLAGAVLGAPAGPLIGEAPRAKQRARDARPRDRRARSAVRRAGAGRGAAAAGEGRAPR